MTDSIPPKQRISKFILVIAILFLAVGVTLYELIAPSIFSSPGQKSFSPLETVGAAVVGAVSVWLGLRVGRFIERRRG
jgi:hypothetical protein